jgi:hypothetical protein
MCKKKKVFISSTCFNLKDLRAELAEEIQSWGFIPIWNESPDFPVIQGLHSHDICLDAVKMCDVYILIIDSRYGGKYQGTKYPHKDISITQYESQIAFNEGKEIYTFVRDEIWNEKPVYKKNLENNIVIHPFHAKDIEVFNFIDFIIKQKSNNWIEQFKTSIDLKSKLCAKMGIIRTEISTNNSDLGKITNDFTIAEITLIKELNEIFTGHAMYQFFENLSDSQTVYLNQIMKFEFAINRFLAPDKKFRNQLLENGKADFLISLNKFLSFCSNTFNTLNGDSSRFYAGISEIDMIKRGDFYEKDYKKYLRLARNLHKRWSSFLEVINKEYPYYEWSND